MDFVKALKDIFKKILHIGTREEKDTVVEEVGNYYDNKFYNKKDIVYIAKDTDKEELYEYVDIDKEYNNYIFKK